MSLSGMREIEFSILPLNLFIVNHPTAKRKMGASSPTKPSPEAEWLDNVPLRSRTAGNSLRTFALQQEKSLESWFLSRHGPSVGGTHMEKFITWCTIPVNIEFWEISSWKTHHEPYPLRELHFFCSKVCMTREKTCWIKRRRNFVEKWLTYLLNFIRKFEQILYTPWNFAKTIAIYTDSTTLIIKSLIKNPPTWTWRLQVQNAKRSPQKNRKKPFSRWISYIGSVVYLFT